MVADEALAPHFCQDIGQIFFWIEAVRLARLDDAVDGGARLGSFRAVAEEPVLPADGEGTDGAFCCVVRHGDAAVAEVAAEAFLRIQGIVHRLGRLEFRQEPRADGFQPREEVLDQRLFLAEACFLPFFRRKVVQFFFDGSNGANLADGFPSFSLAVLRGAQDVFSSLPRICGEGFHEFPPHVRPARGMLHGEPVVAVELVVHEDAVEAFEEFLGVLAAPSGAVFEDSDVRALRVERARGVEPHPGDLVLPLGSLCALLVDLHGRLVGVKHVGGNETRLHLPDEREEIVPAEPDGPVRHVRPAEREAECLPRALLPVERDGERIFLAEDVRGKFGRHDGMREEGRGNRCVLDSEAVFRLACGALPGFLVDVDDFDLLRDVMDFRPHELFAEFHKRRSRVAVAEAFRLWERDGFLLVGDAFEELVAFPLRLARVRLHGGAAGVRFRLARLRFLLGFVEEGDLAVVRLENADLLGFPSEQGFPELLVPDERGFELLFERCNLLAKLLVFSAELLGFCFGHARFPP